MTTTLNGLNKQFNPNGVMASILADAPPAWLDDESPQDDYAPIDDYAPTEDPISTDSLPVDEPVKNPVEDQPAGDLHRDIARAMSLINPTDRVGKIGVMRGFLSRIVAAPDEQRATAINAFRGILAGDAIVDQFEKEVNETIAGEKPGVLRGKWQLRTMVNAYEDRPPVEFVVDEFFSIPSLNIVYGAPGSLKSMILADCAACVAAGKPWLAPLPVEDNSSRAFVTKSYPILWIDYDNGKRRTDDRFGAVGRAHDLPVDANLYYMSMDQPTLAVTNLDHVRDLAEMIKEIGAKFIVMDNLGLISGDADENTDDMAAVMGNLRWLCEETQSVVTVIHHQRKGSPGEKIGDMLRGHSSINSAIDLGLCVNREEGEDKVTLSPTKVRGAVISRTVTAEFTYQHKQGSRDLDVARFWGVETVSKSEKATGKVEAAILIILRREGKPVMQADLVDAVIAYMEANNMKKAGRDKTVGIIGEMVAAKRLIAESGGKNSKLYSISEKEAALIS
jgi:hypothetical protein